MQLDLAVTVDDAAAARAQAQIDAAVLALGLLQQLFDAAEEVAVGGGAEVPVVIEKPTPVLETTPPQPVPVQVG